MKPPGTSSTANRVINGPLGLLYAAPQPNKHKFQLLTTIVNHMKTRHQNDFTHPLTLDELLEESGLNETITNGQKNWLLAEALPNNPKIKTVEVNVSGVGKVTKFLFKPKHSLKNKSALMALLDHHDQEGLGGILVDDIIEGMPKAKRRLKALKDKIILVQGAEKKEVAFLADPSSEFKMDEEFTQLWRSIPIDALEENKIEEYLNANGLASIKDTNAIKPINPKRRKASRRGQKYKTHNQHVEGLLVDYSKQ